MAQLSEAKLAELIAILRPQPPEDVPEGSRLTVHGAVSRFAFLYEKIRNAVDYQDDHLLRKSAILRILKRQLVLEADADQIATHLVRELIAARYLPNGTLNESIVTQAADIIRKLKAVLSHRSDAHHQRWLMGIVAAELEETFGGHVQEQALVHFLYEPLGDRITLRQTEMDDTERRLQVYIACYRALFKVDDELLGYKLVRAYYSAWMHPETWIEHREEMALQMIGVEMRVRAQLRHRLGQKFLSAVKPWAISLSLLRKVLQEHPKDAEQLLRQPAELENAIQQMAGRLYKESHAKLHRGIVRAMIYLFITKILIAFAIEVPLETILYAHLNYIPLIINVLLPPTIMFFVGSLIRVPGKDNTARIVRGAEELLSPEGPRGREIRIPKTHSAFGKFLFSVFYAFTFLLTFGLVYDILNKLHFTWISSIIFIFFLTVVSFFAFRLRQVVRECVVVERVDSFTQAVMDFFSLPILRVGQALSQSISRLNIFIFFFDFIIEAPFKLFLNVLEEWFSFMKEKKDELR